MSDNRPVALFAIVFNCLTCGQMLSVIHNWSEATCPNCGAQYMGEGDPHIHRYYEGRPAPQWISNGYTGPAKPESKS